MNNDLPIPPSEVLEEDIAEADLRMNPKDAGIVVGGALVSLLPGGGLIEKLGAFVHKTRADRLEEFTLKVLRKNAATFEKVFNDLEGLQDATRPEMLLEAVSQADHAKTDQRLEYLARVLVDGVEQSDTSADETELVFKILRALSDEQIIILYSRVYFSPETREQREFMAKFPGIGFPDRPDVEGVDWRNGRVILSERIRGLSNAGLAETQLEGVTGPGNQSIQVQRMSHMNALAEWFLERIGLRESPPTPLNSIAGSSAG